MIDPSLFEPLFKRWAIRAPVSDDDKVALIDLPWTERSFNRDSYIDREGERTSHCNLLLGGLAFRQKLVRTGSRQIICFHIPGEFVDLQNCYFDVADHNVQALTRLAVAEIDKKHLVNLISARQGVRRAIWIDTLIDSSIFREWVVNVGRRDAKTRIAHLLCELAARLDQSGVADGSAYDFPITQEQIADATGLTAVHTNRTLQSLRKEGLISLSSATLTIMNWSGLAEAADFSDRYLHYSS